MNAKALKKALAALDAACGKTHSDSMGGACCQNCEVGLPCDCTSDGGVCPMCGKNPCACDMGCPACGMDPCVCDTCPVCGESPCACGMSDNAEMEEVDTPYEYLDELEQRYREQEALAATANMSLEDWLDKQAALYQMEGARAGVRYIDEIEDNREELEEQEEELMAAVRAVETAVSALRMPDSPPEALGLVLKAVSKSQTLAKAGRFDKAQEALEDAVGLAQAILQEDMFREAAQIREGLERERFSRMYAKAVKAGVVEKGLWRRIRREANRDLERAGFDGNGRFKSIAAANNALAKVLDKHGLQIATVLSADLYRQKPGGTARYDLEFINPSDPFSPVAFHDSLVVFQYHIHDNDLVEVVAYLS